MTREQAAELARSELTKHGLSDWHVRLNTKMDNPRVKTVLGMCDYKTKSIIINAYHIDMHPEPEVVCTILHEIAHALCPGCGHNETWAAKAKEIGCDNTLPCATMGFPAEVVDALRSGADVEVSFDEHVIRTPKYNIKRLQEVCPECGKVAKEAFTLKDVDKDGNEVHTTTLECFHIITKIIPKATPFEKFTTAEHRNNGCEHDWDKNKCKNCGAFRLFDFQVEGARFIEKSLAVNLGAGIFDEMGLGKTIQPLAYLYYHPEAFPTLFVVKSGLMFQFFKAILQWLGDEYLAQIINTSKDPILPGLKCYIISYDLLRRIDDEKLASIGAKTIILDECQQIKNPDSTRTQEVRKLVKNAQNVIPLSGTPWKNRGSEFFVTLNMLNPTKFPSYQRFLNRWVEYYWHGERLKEGGIANPKAFKEYVKDMIIRRERTEVMKELPLINRTIHYTELDEKKQKVYDEEVSEFVKWYNEKVIGGEEDEFDTQQNILARLMRMRHITGLAKIPATVEFVHDHIEETGRKIVVFVHHKDVGQILYEEFKAKYPEMRVIKLTGGMSPQARDMVQTEFNETEKVIMIASTLAAGEGLNLQTCCDCIIHERQWNPANEEQAEGRFIRIGQTAQQVNGTYVTAAGTVDEFLANIVEAKRTAFYKTMSDGTTPTWNQTGLVQELAENIVKDATKLQKMVSV